MARERLMLRRIRRGTIARAAAVVCAALLAFSAGPWQGSAAAVAAESREAAARREAEARPLDLHELQVIRGRQMGGPGGLYLQGGPPQPWGFSFPDLGGYGVIGGGNQHVAIPLFRHGGRGLSFALYHNSQSVPNFPLYGPNPPIAPGWSHTFLTSVTSVSGGAT